MHCLYLINYSPGKWAKIVLGSSILLECTGWRNSFGFFYSSRIQKKQFLVNFDYYLPEFIYITIKVLGWGCSRFRIFKAYHRYSTLICIAYRNFYAKLNLASNCQIFSVFDFWNAHVNLRKQIANSLQIFFANLLHKLIKTTLVTNTSFLILLMTF